jgi:C4-dicarboxylate transporter
MRGPLVLLVSAMLVVAGCARSASPSSAGASVAAESPACIGDAGGGSHGPAFVVQVSFTGETEIHGSFLDL